MTTMASTAVVLAGGLGTRLLPAVADRPKCLAPVGTTTFLALQLELLAERGVHRFVLALGHRAAQVLRAIEPLCKRHVIAPVVEPEPLGTGGAVLNAMDASELDECLVVNGDTWLDADLDALLRPLAVEDDERVRVGCVLVADRGRYGGVVVGEHGRISGFEPKGAHGVGLINAGLYRLHRDAFDERPVGSAFSLESDVVPRLVAAGCVTAVPLEGTFIDIGVPDDYRRFCELQG
jgi:D-glycero-alpha-D-manno-heptose 1-phosphate guanylyltransferase